MRRIRRPGLVTGRASMKASNRDSRVGDRQLPWTLDPAVETLGTIGDQSSFSCSICSIYFDVARIERWGSGMWRN